MIRRASLVIVLAVAGIGLCAGAASASLGDEVAAGRQVGQRVDAGSVACGALTDADFEHLGEYAMQRMLRSSGAHEAMNARMTAMLGGADAERMHRLLGRRYAGCPTAASGGGMRSGMMGGAVASGGWAAMMRSRDLAWMRNGAWRHMSQTSWQRLGTRWMGASMMSPRGAWSVWAVLAVVLGGLVVGGLAVFALLQRPWRRHRTSGPATT
jgi:hypothetical protein